MLTNIFSRKSMTHEQKQVDVKRQHAAWCNKTEKIRKER